VCDMRQVRSEKCHLLVLDEAEVEDIPKVRALVQLHRVVDLTGKTAASNARATACTYSLQLVISTDANHQSDVYVC
jgi:hypothetical protein